jgi:hypothetical protein
MEALRELMGHAERHWVAGASGVADLNETGGGLLGNSEGKTGGAAHGEVGGLAVDQDCRRIEAEGAKMDADQFDLTEGQSGSRDNVVDTGLGEYLRNGLGARAGHFLSL